MMWLVAKILCLQLAYVELGALPIPSQLKIAPCDLYLRSLLIQQCSAVQLMLVRASSASNAVCFDASLDSSDVCRISIVLPFHRPGKYSPGHEIILPRRILIMVAKFSHRPLHIILVLTRLTFIVFSLPSNPHSFHIFPVNGECCQK